MSDSGKKDIDVEKIMDIIRHEVNQSPAPNYVNEERQGHEGLKIPLFKSDIDFHHINSSIVFAQNNVDIASEVTPMERFPLIVRYLARLAGKIVIFLASFITDRQKLYNISIVNALKGVVNNVQKTNSEHTDKIAHLEKQQEDLKNSTDDLKGATDDLKGATDDLKGTTDDLKNRIDHLKGTIDALMKEKKEHAQTVEALIKGHEEYKGKAETMANELMEYKCTIEALMKERVESRDDIEVLKEGVINNLIKEKQELKGVVDNLMQERQESRDATDNLMENVGLILRKITTMEEKDL